MNRICILDSPAFGKVRAVQINNETWFSAADVCRVLGHSNPTMAVKGLNADERLTLNFADIENKMTLNFEYHDRKGKRGGARFAVFVNEPGLYALILRSNRPEAKTFKKWITREVLPSIRRTGGYIHGWDKMTDDELLEAALRFAQNRIDLHNKEKAAVSAANADNGKRDTD